MKKWLKVGIPILVAVLVLVIGAGVVVANDNDYSRCPRYAGSQYLNCPCAGSGGGWQGPNNSYCTGPGACYGLGGRYGDNDAGYQPPCHR
jgi:hypothetical protein